MVFSIAVLAAVVIGSPYLVRRWKGDLTARVYLAALLSSPALNSTLRQLGTADPFTIFAATLVTIGPAWAVGAGGLLLGFNHFEQGLFIIGGAAVIRWLMGDRRFTIGFGVLGLVIGKLLLKAYFTRYNIEVGKLDRFDFVKSYLGGRSWTYTLFGNLPTVIFSIYNVGWVAMVYLWRRVPRRTRLTLLGLQVVLFIPVIITVDSTRVAAMVTWPIVVFAVCWFGRHIEREQALKWSLYLFVAALIVPRVVVLGGVVSVASYWEMLASLWGPKPV